jgi:hypothetical protein
MRTIWILNIGDYLLDPNSGVYQKYQSIESALSPIQPVRLVCFSSQNPGQPSERITHVPINKKQKWETIQEWITQNVSKSDIIWLRYPFACRGLFEITKLFGSQIFFEHNTNEEAEALILQRRNWKKHALEPKKWIQRSWWIFTWKTFIKIQTDETTWGQKCRESAKGGIAVTYELKAWLSKKNPNYPVFVLPNCVNKIESTIEHKKKDTQSKKIKLVMLIGTYDHWQGAERIVNSLIQSKFIKYQFQLDIYGDCPIQLKKNRLPDHIMINHHASITKENLKETTSQYDIGVGTLQLYKKNMQEACPLKVREYWKNGLPCMIGYQDTAILQHPELAQYNLIVENNGHLINTEVIEEFFEKKVLQATFKTGLKNLVNESISYESKMNGLITFFDSLKMN